MIDDDMDEIDGPDRSGRFGERGERPMGNRCRICRENMVIDYKNAEFLRQFIGEGGKIQPRARTGNCAKHQRLINQAVKRARMLALLPFTV